MSAQLEIVLVDQGGNEPNYDQMPGVPADQTRSTREALGVRANQASEAESKPEQVAAKKSEASPAASKPSDSSKESIRDIKQGGNALLSLLGVDQVFGAVKDFAGKTSDVIKGFESIARLITDASLGPKQNEPERSGPDTTESRGLQLGVPESRVKAVDGHASLGVDGPEGSIDQSLAQLAEAWKPTVIGEILGKAVSDAIRDNDQQGGRQGSDRQSGRSAGVETVENSPSMTAQKPPVQKEQYLPPQVGRPEGDTSIVNQSVSNVDNSSSQSSSTNNNASQSNTESKNQSNTRSNTTNNTQSTSKQFTDARRWYQSSAEKKMADPGKTFGVKRTGFSGGPQEASHIVKAGSSVESAAATTATRAATSAVGAGAEAATGATAAATGAEAAGAAAGVGTAVAGAEGAGAAVGAGAMGLGGAAATAAAALLPVGVALGVVAAAAGAAALGIKVVSDTLKAEADRLEKYSPEVARKRAEGEIQSTQNMMGRAKEIGPELAKVESARNRFNDATEKLWTEILTLILKFEPQIEVVADGMTAAVRLGQVMVASFERLIASFTADGGVDDAAAKKSFDDATAAFEQALSDVFRDNDKDDPNQGMDPFLAELLRMPVEFRQRGPLGRGGM